MFCSKCGKELEADSAFCPSCGSTVGKTSIGKNSDIIQSMKNHKKIIVIGAVVLIVLFIIIGVASSSGKDSDDGYREWNGMRIEIPNY